MSKNMFPKRLLHSYTALHASCEQSCYSTLSRAIRMKEIEPLGPLSDKSAVFSCPMTERDLAHCFAGTRKACDLFSFRPITDRPNCSL
jgi:hypothetical protein